MGDGGFSFGLGEGIGFGDGDGDEGTGGEAELAAGVDGGGDLLGGIEADIGGEATTAAEESGDVISLVADDGDAMGFEKFVGEGHIEDGFAATGDDGDGGAAEFDEVGADVEGVAAVDAADATGGKNLDTGLVGENHGTGDGGAAIFLIGDSEGDITAAAFADRVAWFLGEGLELVGGEADMDLAGEEGDGGGRGAAVTDGGFHILGCFEVLGVGEAVGDDGTFEGDDWFAVGEGGFDGGVYV